MKTYEDYCNERLKRNCVPISEIEWKTGLTLHQLAEKYKTPFQT